MRVTFDSNILVYAADADAGERHMAAVDLIGRAAHADCVFTLQSIAEFFYVTTGKARLSVSKAAGFVDDWGAVFPVHAANLDSLVNAVGAVHRHRMGFWDAMIWAAARGAGCRLLLSDDLQDGRTLDGVMFVNPFTRQNAMLVEAALPRLES